MTENEAFSVPDDWRGKMITQIRKLIQQADPEVSEEVKYKTKSNPNGVLVWYREGMMLTGEIYQKHLRLSFSKGPALKGFDTKGLINSYRAILLHEDDQLDDSAFVDLIREAVKLNQKGKSK